jgi:hypothetical protein
MFEEWGYYGGKTKKREKKRKGIQDSRFLNVSRRWLKWKPIDRGGLTFHVPCIEHS